MNGERAKLLINRGDHEWEIVTIHAFVTPDGYRWDATTKEWSPYPWPIELIEANKARHTLGLPLCWDNNDPIGSLMEAGNLDFCDAVERLARKGADCA
jgi:hypothetical protein